MSQELQGELLVHEFKLPANVLRNIDDTDRHYIRRLLQSAVTLLPQFNDSQLRNHSDPLVQSLRFGIVNTIATELTQVHNIFANTQPEVIADIMRTRRIEYYVVSNYDHRVYFHWFIQIENPFEYLFITSQKDYFS